MINLEDNTLTIGKLKSLTFKEIHSLILAKNGDQNSLRGKNREKVGNLLKPYKLNCSGLEELSENEARNRFGDFYDIPLPA